MPLPSCRFASLDFELRDAQAFGAAGQVKLAAQFAAVGAEREGRFSRYAERLALTFVAGFALANARIRLDHFSPEYPAPRASVSLHQWQTLRPAMS